MSKWPLQSIGYGVRPSPVTSFAIIITIAKKKKKKINFVVLSRTSHNKIASIIILCNFLFTLNTADVAMNDDRKYRRHAFGLSTRGWLNCECVRVCECGWMYRNAHFNFIRQNVFATHQNCDTRRRWTIPLGVASGQVERDVHRKFVSLNK